MVCLEDEESVETKVTDTTTNKQFILTLQPSKTICSIFDAVADKFDYPVYEIEVYLTNRSGTFKLNYYKHKTLRDLAIKCSEDMNNTITVTPMKESTEDDLLLGASASPIGTDMPNSVCVSEAAQFPASREGTDYSFLPRTYKPVINDTPNYVGLVNQAMTCYLNSLLQALYMTPEFRNALYIWKWDGKKETRSVPFQLQKLFLNLQTSPKSAVETTDLTTSFGWHGSDAWQQHDIQELCRVMFDALEMTFKDTKQANLINDLYEGKMLDYVKCLECGTVKSREDTFLDIPLPVRPFDSTVSYNSVEEALGAFVQPETLKENNQYHCEKCNKKCDAHKGLKFIKFPYLLTLHLKRFDFDYNTMHRIKLNDKVVFPEKLNLNSFIDSVNEHDLIEDREIVVKCDDCSTTDSGSALDDESCQGTDVSSTINGQDDNCGDSDEGIDVSSGNNHNENDAKGPYNYELFSILIHSGSASGGHYYAYIKDFDKNQWFCFNDQTVTRITEEDIRRSYGGTPHRGYYSGAYTTSTNAYMLMYRQIDKERNCKAMSVEEFPPHITALLKHIREKEEQDRINREKEKDIIKINVFCLHPITNILQDHKISMFIDSTLEDAAKLAHQKFKLDKIVALEDCRIVSYNKQQESIDANYESDDIKFSDIYSNMGMYREGDFFLEIKKPGTEFKVYKQGGLNMKIYFVDWETENIDAPILVRVETDETVEMLKHKLSNIYKVDSRNLYLALEMFGNGPKLLENTDVVFDMFDENCTEYKMYVSCGMDEDLDRPFESSRLRYALQKFGYVMMLEIVLPPTDNDTLEMLSIPPLDLNQNTMDSKLETHSDKGLNSPALRVSPQPTGIDGFGDQSNSEDSSLSDSDRTLVGEAPVLLSSSSNSPADHHMASPSDPAEDSYNYDVLGHPSEEMHWDDDETYLEGSQVHNYYFRVTSKSQYQTLPSDMNSRYCTILVDRRMTLEALKKHLEPVINVPMEYFKVFRYNTYLNNPEDEWTKLNDTLKIAKEGERLTLKLGRVPRKDEQSCKVYHFRPECNEYEQFLLEHIISKGQSVGQLKKEILLQAKKQNLLDIPYSRCRLREKSWKKPKKVYLDHQKFNEDIKMNSDIFLQELNDVEKVTSPDQLVLFVRHWCPSTLTLKPFEEVVLETTAVEELKKRLSELISIPVENVEIALVKTNFPCDMHILDIQKDLEWNPNGSQLDDYPISATDGSVFFYRNSEEPLKELTPEERKEIASRENARLGRYSVKTYSPAKETGVKIHIYASSPCKTEDNCID